MSLIPSVEFSQLPELLSDRSRVSALKSFEVTVNDAYLLTVMVARTDYIRTQADYLGELSNSIGGQDPNELLNKLQSGSSPCQCKECGKVFTRPIALSGHMRSHKALAEV